VITLFGLNLASVPPIPIRGLSIEVGCKFLSFRLPIFSFSASPFDHDGWYQAKVRQPKGQISREWEREVRSEERTREGITEVRVAYPLL
jgi:hypothetical protein